MLGYKAMVVLCCFVTSAAEAACDGDCEAPSPGHGSVLMQVKGRDGAEHNQKVLLMMSQHPTATENECEACVAAEEALVTPQEALVTAEANLVLAAKALVTAASDIDACPASADCDTLLTAKTHAEKLIATGTKAVAKATRAMTAASSAAQVACHVVRDAHSGADKSTREFVYRVLEKKHNPCNAVVSGVWDPSKQTCDSERDRCDVPFNGIGEYAFEGCTNLKTVILTGTELYSVEHSAFKGVTGCSVCGMDCVDFPWQVEKLWDYESSGATITEWCARRERAINDQITAETATQIVRAFCNDKSFKEDQAIQARCKVFKEEHKTELMYSRVTMAAAMGFLDSKETGKIQDAINKVVDRLGD